MEKISKRCQVLGCSKKSVNTLNNDSDMNMQNEIRGYCYGHYVRLKKDADNLQKALINAGFKGKETEG